MSRSQPLLRCEIRKMLRVDQERFCAAVETMMRPNAHGDPRSSEYFRVAGYHGWPGNYCNHGIESFPAWHRAYLVEFESALQAADRANGYDGNISLPYWDWTDTDQPEMFPAIIRQRFPQLNSDLFPDNNELKQKGYLINSDQYIRLMILGAALSQQCNEAVAHPQHFQAASHEYTQGYSLEDPHDSIHVYCGYPMSVVQFAAFHPIFFLHHCNLDRLYETHLATNPHAQAEFQSHEWSRLLRDIGAANVQRAKSCLAPLELPKLNDMNRPKTLYELPLIPFKHPVTGLDMMPKDCFDTISLGYAYDRLTSIPPQQLQAPLIWAVFRGVDVAGKLASVSYTVFVFVVRKRFEQQWTPPQPKLEALLQSHNLAGITAIFGAKGEGCDNCMKRRKPITLKVNISQALSDQGISRHQAGLRVIAMDHHHQFFLLESTAIPQPMIEGPYFSHSWLLLRQGAIPGVPEAVLEGEVLQLQKFLKKHGYSWYHRIL
ncbi:hypothetical protein CEUSTIGMA_g4663.t1 [Chlamydomonas eustigma]|uniref:Tyrosinase copper-binding domain-containing protein n=1 Tax=Chlamydomonas eustigma TaxID=1157962 RepID=A0A250X2B4_9CHLO|nr:hypothetical protein CEUSTIGMA_g4663.t1 [Chlamydomonas eustigma]|eukprot:GAX77217.1 hypothetical protein CEUSTIGMA_g4663.t1 [Chlamydomonas eustigma]